MMMEFFLILAVWFAGGYGASAYFPAGSCAAQPCSWSPYDFTWSFIDNVGGAFCFNVVPKACEGPCCATFEKLFMKFVIKTKAECKPYFRQVNINGQKKGGGVFFDIYNTYNESELRVTSMAYNNLTVTDQTFCIFVNPPCNDILTFCNGAPCMFSIYDPYTHACCPTCSFLGGNMTTPIFSPIPWTLLPLPMHFSPPSPSPLSLSPSPPPPNPPPSPLSHPPPPNPPPPSPTPTLAPSPPRKPPPPFPPFPIYSPPNQPPRPLDPITSLKCNCTCLNAQ